MQTIFINGLHRDARYRHLIEAFSPFGNVDAVDFVPGRPFAFLDFKRGEDAEHLLKTQPKIRVDEQVVSCERSRTLNKSLLMRKCQRIFDNDSEDEDVRRPRRYHRSRSPERSRSRSPARERKILVRDYPQPTPSVLAQNTATPTMMINPMSLMMP